MLEFRTEEIKEKYKLVFKPSIARELLHLGYKIIDIKPNRIDTNKSVFVFLIEDNFLIDFYNLITQEKENA